MKKAGPLNTALQDIVEIDKQLAAFRAPAVLAWSVAHEIRFLLKRRRDKVSQLQNAGRGLQKAR
jgi:hypothetical protein